MVVAVIINQVTLVALHLYQVKEFQPSIAQVVAVVVLQMVMALMVVLVVLPVVQELMVLEHHKKEIMVPEEVEAVLVVLVLVTLVVMQPQTQ